MGFIKTSIDGMEDVEEPTVHAEGEVDLRIATAELKKAQSGRDMVFVMTIIEAEDGKDYAPIFHNILLPTNDEVQSYIAKKQGQPLDEEGQKWANNFSRFRLDEKRFLACFDVEAGTDGWDPSDLPGREGRCRIKLDEYEGNLKNVLVLPRLK